MRLPSGICIRRIAVTFAALAVLGEIGLRLWDRFHETTGSLYDYVVPVGARFKMRPSAELIVPERYGDIRYRFNRAGYRDVDHDLQGRRSKIVWLGDSVSFGLGVQRERTFVALVQGRLNAGPGPCYEIVNLAIFAYDTRHELDALREDGLRYRPGVVVLQFYMNDLTLSPRGPGSPPPSVVDRLVALKNRILFGSALYRRLYQAVTKLGYLLLHDLRRTRFPQTLNDDEARGQTAYLAAHPDDATIPTFAALQAIDRLATSNGARLLVFVSPDEVQLFTPKFDLVNRRLAAYCRRQGIALYDPLPVLRASPARTELFYDGVHYSERGHAVMARLLFAELNARGLVGAEGLPTGVHLPDALAAAAAGPIRGRGR